MKITIDIFDKMVSILKSMSCSMSNSSFHFDTCFCCLLVPLKVTPHDAWVPCLIIGLTINTIEQKGQGWSWLIYALRNFYYMIMLRVFRNNQNYSWKFYKFHRKTPVGVSFSFKLLKLYKDTCSAWISRTFAKTFSS